MPVFPGAAVRRHAVLPRVSRARSRCASRRICDVVRDILDSMAHSGFRRILIVNGHGGNGAVQQFAQEWAADHPDCRVIFHNWWNAPHTWAKVQAIDPVASHGSWMENFPVDAAARRRRCRTTQRADGRSRARARARSRRAARRTSATATSAAAISAPTRTCSRCGRSRSRRRGALLDGVVGQRVSRRRRSACDFSSGARARSAARWARISRAPATTSPSSTRCASTSTRSTRGGLRITGPIAEFTRARAGVHARRRCAASGTRSSSRRRRITPRAPRARCSRTSSADGCVISAQNGLNELAIAEVVGRGAHGRRVRELRRRLPRARRDSLRRPRRRGRRRDRRPHHAARRARFATRGSTSTTRAIVTPNIWGYLWGKEAYGAMLFATALTNESIADALAMPAYRELYIALAREILAVAAARGVTPEAFDGFDPAAYLPDAPAGAAERSLDAARGAQPALGQDAQRHLARSRGAQAPHRGRCAARDRRHARRAGGRRDAAHRAPRRADSRDRERRARRSRSTRSTRSRAARRRTPIASNEPRLHAARRRSSPAPRTASAARSRWRSRERGARVWACDVLDDELRETQRSAASGGRRVHDARVVDVRDKSGRRRVRRRGVLPRRAASTFS